MAKADEDASFVHGLDLPDDLKKHIHSRAQFSHKVQLVGSDTVREVCILVYLRCQALKTTISFCTKLY